jgi:DNA-binding MarR family transcriptional regulator
MYIKSTHQFREHEAYLVREVHHRLHIKVESELRKRSLYISFPLARVLHMVSMEPGLSGAQLARRFTVAAQSMNGVLVALEKDGYIERKADPENARVLKCYPRPAGVALMQKAIAAAFEVFDSMLNVLTARDRAQLKRSLRTLIETIDVDSAEASELMYLGAKARGRHAPKSRGAR